MVWAVDGDLPNLWIATVARPTRLLGDAKGDDVACVVGRVEAFGTHDTRVIECTVSISDDSAVRLDLVRRVWCGLTCNESSIHLS
jgi:hypothetical protein